MPGKLPRTAVWDPALESLWVTLPHAGVADDARPEVRGAARSLAAHPSRLAVDELAVASVASALRAAALLAAARSGGPAPRVELAAAHVAAAVGNAGLLRAPGHEISSAFAPLSRFWPTAAGWLRTHANYPWHLRALLTATGAGGVEPGARGDTAADAVQAALRTRPALEWEQIIDAAGGVAVAVRSPTQWVASGPGMAMADQPLVSHQVIGAAPARTLSHRDGELPAAGVRVLDLTRVIAGPVATRTFGALGADVLRIDPPARPELDFQRIDGVLGKRSALADLTTREDSRQLHQLLDAADVLVYGYRPGASASLDPAMLAERYPGLVVVRLSAWGERGPWGSRRGFDSLVQAATGIAHLQADQQEEPGALPCQVLDHATGYLAAASTLLCLREQLTTGGTHLVRVSLAATARQLVTMAPVGLGEKPTDKGDWGSELKTVDGATVTAVRPPGALDGVPLSWTQPVHKYGADDLFWA